MARPRPGGDDTRGDRAPLRRWEPILREAGLLFWEWDPSVEFLGEDEPGGGARAPVGSVGVRLEGLLDDVHPADLPSVAQALASARREPREPLRLTFRMRRAPGESFRWVSCQGVWEVPARGGRPAGMVGVLLETPRPPLRPPDLGPVPATLAGARVGVEAAVHRRTVELDVTRTGQEALTYSIAHDLRPPLRAIHGYARLLRDRLARVPDPSTAELLLGIERNALTMARLMDDLLLLSRAGLRRLEVREVDLAAMARRLFVRVAGAAPGARARLEVSPMPTVRGDPDLLELALTHLLDNAVKFSASRPEPVVTLSATRRADEVKVTVSDNGAGFDPSHATRVFGVFERLDPAAGLPGTGIGLAVVERIVRRHGGRVEAWGQPGVGAAVSFTLPCRPEEGEP